MHCTIGASRAPSAVMAYLVYAKGIPLVDAYNYLAVLRPLIAPNQHFLFELAKFEVSSSSTYFFDLPPCELPCITELTYLQCELGDGCSVFFHRDWRFYEFNVFRAEGFPARRQLGLYSTTMLLHSAVEDDENLLK